MTPRPAATPIRSGSGPHDVRWAKIVLQIAAVYNIAWGCAVVVMPTQTLSLLNLDPAPIYPELWQCIGMIVGVYGVGYWLASRDPMTHWPIVVVGLLGKIFGPIGFAWAIWNDRLPALMGATIVTNDLVWWLPFTMILIAAARHHQNETMLKIASQLNGDRPHLQPGDLLDQCGVPFRERVGSGTWVVVFLRHSGCTFCRETLATVREQHASLTSQLADVVLVHMGNENEPTRSFFESYGLGDAPRVSDPGGLLYRQHGLTSGSLGQMFGPRVWWRGAVAFFRGRHGIGRLEGNGFQMPGTAVYVDGVLRKIVEARDASDVPDVCELAASDSLHAVTP